MILKRHERRMALSIRLWCSYELVIRPLTHYFPLRNTHTKSCRMWVFNLRGPVIYAVSRFLYYVCGVSIVSIRSTGFLSYIIYVPFRCYRHFLPLCLATRVLLDICKIEGLSSSLISQTTLDIRGNRKLRWTCCNMPSCFHSLVRPYLGRFCRFVRR